MKTIFVLIPHGYLLRNIVSTGILDKLLEQPNIRVIALTLSPQGLEHLIYPKSKLIVENFPISPRFTFFKILHRILRIRFEKINENNAMKTLVKIYRKWSFSQYLFDCIISHPFPRSRRIYDWLYFLSERYGGVSDDVQSLFKLYQPDLVFSTNPTRTIEYPFLKYSIQSGIKTIGMIKSWDVMLTKGYIPVRLDYYLTWNNIMKSDLMRLHNIDKESIGVTGVPQFDIYSKSVSNTKRKKFLEEIGLNSQKKTILFSTSTPWVGFSEPAILNNLGKYLIENNLENSIQILARLHPHDDFVRYKDINFPNLVFQLPGLSSDLHNNERFLDPNYLDHLRNAIICSDTVINTASTVSIEAAVLGKPVVNLAFDMKKVDYWKSSQRFYEFEHYQPIIDSGGVKLANSFEELILAIFDYLDDPKLGEKGRAILCEKMCYKIDGLSSQRVTDHILSMLDGNRFEDVTIN